jgi:hypothetical protein
MALNSSSVDACVNGVLQSLDLDTMHKYENGVGADYEDEKGRPGREELTGGEDMANWRYVGFDDAMGRRVGSPETVAAPCPSC